MQRSPSKQFSSVITNKNGQEIVYFLSSSGNVVTCNLTCKCFSEYPRLLPVYNEYSIDVVECNGEMLVVLLSEFYTIFVVGHYAPPLQIDYYGHFGCC